MQLSNLTGAIHTRKSRRNFLPKPLKAEHYDKLSEFIGSIEVPFENDVAVSLHYAGGRTPFMPFKGPEHFAAFTGEPGILSQAKTGFTGELFILFAESLGIGTCWYGHYLKNNVYQVVYGDKDYTPLGAIYCVTPLGYYANKKYFTENVTDLLFRKKKSVEQNLHPDSVKSIPPHILSALELACLAPSAMNSQCWYFKVTKQDSEYIVEISKPVGYQHFKWKYTDIDVGAAACHFWLGLLNQQTAPVVELKEISDRAVWTFTVDDSDGVSEI